MIEKESEMIVLKKVAVIIIVIISILSIVAILGGVYFISTPEYALMKMIDDIEEDGLNGLKPYLTGNAEKAVNTITEISENKIVNSIIEMFDKENKVSILKEKIQETHWEVDDILKSNDKAIVIVAFNYNDELVGTIKLNLIRNDGWKIDSLDFPKFDEINFD